MTGDNLSPVPAGMRLPLAFLYRYTAFLFRRRVSRSNSHYLETRLEGLKSLAQLLDHEAVSDVAGLLRRLNVPNLQRLAPQLLERLRLRVRNELPPDVVVTPHPPDSQLLTACRRILLILGPGIGIGDEIICFPLPRWLRRIAPGAEVSTLSAYPGLWDRVADVALCRTYDCYSDVVKALRNDRPEAADLVVLVDFEDPALHPLMLPEPSVRLYLEISIGGRSAVLADCERRWLHRLLLPGPYDMNYYQALWGIADWLGSAPRPGDHTVTVQRNGVEPSTRRDTELRILVCPFTSKHEPSEAFWSQLLSSAVPRRAGGTVRMIFDPGPNAFTRRFAHALARSTEARCPHPVRCEVLGDGEPGPVSLQRVFAAMETSHAVICIDSFAAHAARPFGCVTLVMGWAGLENWRIPAGPSFYFDRSAAVEAVASAMRHVLEALGAGTFESAAGPRLTRGQAGLLDAAEHLGEVLSNGEAASPRALADACSRFAEVWPAGLGESEIETPATAELFRDYPYSDLRLPRLRTGALAPGERADVERHLRHQYWQWRGTNLSKYLELMRAVAMSAEGAR